MSRLPHKLGDPPVVETIAQVGYRMLWVPRFVSSAVTQWRPVDHLDIHDSPVDDVEVEHVLRSKKRDRADCAARAALGAWEIACATGSRRALAELARVRRIVGGAAESAAAARFTAVFDAHAGQAGLVAGERAAR